jgi:hypothetical protein
MADTGVEVNKQSYAQFEQELPPILVVETTAHGWRGLTMDGIVFNVESSGGHVIDIPYGGHVSVTRNGAHVGYRTVPRQATPGVIDRYLRCVEIAGKAMKAEHPDNALAMIETAMSFVPTLATQYSRGIILLEMGHWQEGLAEYTQAMEYPGSSFARPQYRECVAAGLPRWRGEDIHGKRLLLIHDHGFGDSIMMLRYVPILRAMGAEVLLRVPRELERLASQCAPVVNELIDVDYFCPLLFLLEVLRQSPSSMLSMPSYLKVDRSLLSLWKERLHDKGTMVGVAWSPGVVHENDYPRDIPLAKLVEALSGVALVSLQRQGGVEADQAGVLRSAFEDFADCAALMSCCDEVVTIDTAAVHLAGAIGHPNVKLLLSHWASWRWLAPLYPSVRICRQDKPDDWDSALLKMRN